MKYNYIFTQFSLSVVVVFPEAKDTQKHFFQKVHKMEILLLESKLRAEEKQVVSHSDHSAGKRNVCHVHQWCEFLAVCLTNAR